MGPDMMDTLTRMSASELALRLRRRQISARDVLRAHLDLVERVNPIVNAIVTVLPDDALRRAAFADEEAAHGRFLGPLHGLPIAHKDLFETAGMRTTYGSPVFRDYIPIRDSTLR